MTSYGTVTNRTNIFNFPVQGFATGEIIPIALVLLWHMVKDLRVVLTATVHDSVIMEVHPDDVDALRELCAFCFTKGVYEFLERVYSYKFKVPLGIGFKAGNYWGHGSEWQMMLEPTEEFHTKWKVKD